MDIEKDVSRFKNDLNLQKCEQKLYRTWCLFCESLPVSFNCSTSEDKRYLHFSFTNLRFPSLTLIVQISLQLQEI